MKKSTLIDKYLPQFTFTEFHEIVVNRPIEIVYHVAKNFDLSKSKIITFLLCVAPVTKFTFGLYWTFIKPFSGLIRKRMLKIIKDDSESIKLSS